jgi:hypothetical protein
MRKSGFIRAILAVLALALIQGCAGPQTVKETVMTEYFLKEAGFEEWPVNMQTFHAQSLMEAIPQGKIVTYRLRGETYHVYSDVGSNKLYVGDEVAYQKYLAMAQGRQLCERVDATESAPFWRCFDELQPGRKR